MTNAWMDEALAGARAPEWRAVKERIRLCIDKVRKDEFARPYRITHPQTGCGFALAF